MINRKLKKRIIRISAIIFFVVCICFAFLIRYFTSPINIDKGVIFVVDKNLPANTVINNLFTQKILSCKLVVKPLIRIYFKLSGRYVMSGKYRFDKNFTPAHILKAITEGSRQDTRRVTYPEGITIKDFARITEQNLGISASDFMYYANSDSLRNARKIKSQSLEGYLFPATYIFTTTQTAEQIIDRLLDQSEQIWNNKFAKQANAAGKSRHTVLTLASIVEAETPNASERPRIAGVYLNRLRIGMRLEADPTVQYAIGGKKRLTYADLDVNSPYNTYRNTGVPPGPINNPSESSIAAALNPEHHNYIFFVAIGDSTLKHRFASNFSAHKRNIALYKSQKNR